MDAFTPDLTGVDIDYFVTTYRRTIFRYPQKLMFDVPVFRNTRLQGYMIMTTSVPLIEGTDYQIQPDDLDYDAMSVCRNIDPTFNKELLKSITIISPYVFGDDNDYIVQLAFQQLYVDQINYARINKDRQIDLTPTLLSNMVEQIDYLQQMILKSGGDYTPQSAEARFLDECPAGNMDDHVIDGEIHTVNTLIGVKYINPVYGAFFRDSVVLTNPETSNDLVEDTDYEIIEADLTKTAISSNRSGVYRTIKIITDFVGTIKIKYRAYGGSTDIVGIRNISDRVKLVEEYLSLVSPITPKTLSADPTIISIHNKLQEMDGAMRLLLKNGLPSYGDVSTGTALLKKVVAADSLGHWWNIATLYRVEGSSDDILADVIKFRLKSLLSGMMFECAVAVNVSNQAANRITVSCIDSNMPADVLNKFTPRLRILEVKVGGLYSGVVLQFGMKLGMGILQETFDIEDMSGRESCWKLIPFSATSVPPEDTGVLMPNGTSIFATGEVNSVVNEAEIPFKDGLGLLLPNSNVPLEIDLFNSVLNPVTVEKNLIVQAVGDISLDKLISFDCKIIYDIAGAGSIIDFIIPVTIRNKFDMVWYGTTEVVIGTDLYKVTCKLFYDENTSAYSIEFMVKELQLSTIRTLNLIELKLTF